MRRESRSKRPATPAAARPARPVKSSEPSAAHPPRSEALTLTTATAGDHHAIFQFLVSVFHNPSRDSFLASLDDPFYEPTNRLLIKSGSRIVAHVHLTPREMCLGNLHVPVAGLSGLGTWPEFRGQGLAQRALEAAEQQMARDGAALGLLRTKVPHFFRAAGWAVCGRHSHSRAGTRDVLSQIIERHAPAESAALSIRPCRQVELPALMRLHAAHSAGSTGWIRRSEAYWRWLISRKGFDQIFVAIHGPESQELNDQISPIVGYVVTREDEILEMVASPEHPAAAPQLLARACAEAVERDFHSVVFHAPPDEPLHRLFQVAGGTRFHHESAQGEVFMVKLLDSMAFLRSLCGELHQRAEAAGLPRPCELGLLLGGTKHCLIVSRRSVKLVRNKLGRSYLSMNDAEFARLLLGHVDLDAAVASGRLEVSTRVAQDTARVLFPRLPLWRPPLDEISE